ncbi:MAG: hypothetical protein A2887_02565 [Alphaproteobacteria bacterium RIFCSPLOWO2_01_FULL_40_26]|nr:MAG: hypothetical protein A3D15_03335 [Alphaproteobacteria bacterium RIFCSPHIGHO2_02_FULL_40_34]OFW94867.1 MAG: hypothetical protein A2887_02565 [Alphaproteobacteria bacterium RIFCSPLOWO2_01_FULL_40_26]OFX10493.1 MAG: hypothetical protein A3H30_03975 [Alphaproteobacteria bacterium RIFCSPLOWO2_02_FULL_40_19]OFX10958.1 MAG: hypothetical protein A3G22_02470 [Alphaproteobacteria bacterium RIFCSPLOWO2_12_FULL_40_11]
MTKKILNFAVTIFVAIFIVTIFSTVKSASSQSRNFRVKSHLQFDQKFSGNAFILDGDSIKVGGKEVRLFGLDAPEYNQKCFNEKNKEYACGQKSRDFLISLAGGKQVECFYAIKDKYDRYLGKCYVDKLSINEEIIKNGMAVIYNFTESDEKMEKLEKEAQTAKIGIWQGTFQLPKDYRKENPRQN